MRIISELYRKWMFRRRIGFMKRSEISLDIIDGWVRYFDTKSDSNLEFTDYLERKVFVRYSAEALLNELTIINEALRDDSIHKRNIVNKPKQMRLSTWFQTQAGEQILVEEYLTVLIAETATTVKLLKNYRQTSIKNYEYHWSKVIDVMLDFHSVLQSFLIKK